MSADRPVVTHTRLVSAFLLRAACFVLAAGCTTVSPSSPSPASSAAPNQTVQSQVAPSESPVPSEGTEASVEASLDACALLSVSELSKVIGGEAPVGRAIPAAGWVAGQCAWSSPTAAFLMSVGTAASIRSVGDPGVSDARSKLADFEQRVATGGTPRPIAGIGDGAIVADSGVAAYKGDVYLEVVNLRLTEDQMIEIVRLAVDNLE